MRLLPFFSRYGIVISRNSMNIGIFVNKVANYLRGRITGSVSARADWRMALRADAGILAATPELVVIPQHSDDICTIARFAWQMAEKGHNIPIVTRGMGQGVLGGAVGQGVILDMSPYMRRVFEYDSKSQRVRVQPGVSAEHLNSTLALHGAGIGALIGQTGTVGGVLASGSRSASLNKSNNIIDAIDQLEVVLANGETIQTERISRRELQRRKQLQTMEGDIYRGLDELITDNASLIEQLDPYDVSGYGGIAHVKGQDGSFDLGPLFVGSEGALGIIDELILKTEFFSFRKNAIALVFSDGQTARAAIDEIDALQVSRMEYFDAVIFEQLRKEGKVYDFYENAAREFAPRVVILVEIDDFNNRTQTRKQHKLEQMQIAGEVAVTVAEDEADDVWAAFAVLDQYCWPDTAQVAATRLFEGFYIPPQQFESFTRELPGLAKILRLPLPLAGHPGNNLYGVYPYLSLRKVSDKQKIFKLYDELAKLLRRHDGYLVGSGGEGRLKARFTQSQQSVGIADLYHEIKRLFDPYGILSPDNKTPLKAQTITTMLRNEYSVKPM